MCLELFINLCHDWGVIKKSPMIYLEILEPVIRYTFEGILFSHQKSGGRLGGHQQGGSVHTLSSSLILSMMDQKGERKKKTCARDSWNE